MRQVIDRAQVSRWLTGYETAWRAPGTEGLAGLFTSDATYLKSPCEPPITGLDAIKRMWEAERDGPDEVFTMVTSIVAVDGPAAVVRAEVCYGDPPSQEYRDLWVVRFADDGRSTWFEEWPYWPERPYSAPDDDRHDREDPMADELERISSLLTEVSETHHRVFRIVDGADDDWASWYAPWLIDLSELPEVLGAKPVRSELIYMLVGLDKQYTAEAPSEPWETYYAREILRHFRPSGS